MTYFTLLLTSSGQDMAISYFLLTSSGQQMAISYSFQHPVIKIGNFTLLPTSSDQVWQFHIPTDI